VDPIVIPFTNRYIATTHGREQAFQIIPTRRPAVDIDHIFSGSQEQTDAIRMLRGIALADLTRAIAAFILSHEYLDRESGPLHQDAVQALRDVCGVLVCRDHNAHQWLSFMWPTQRLDIHGQIHFNITTQRKLSRRIRSNAHKRLFESSSFTTDDQSTIK
jgi:hypothetical protein